MSPITFDFDIMYKLIVAQETISARKSG